MQKHVRSKTRSGQALRAIALTGNLFNQWLPGSLDWQKTFLLLLLGLLLPLCNLQAQTTYTWIGGTTGAWGTSTNWSPTRSTSAITDIIKFDPAANGGVANITVTAFATANIGRLEVSNGATVAIQHTATAQQQIRINGDGGALTDMYVETGSTLKMDNKAALTVNLGLVFVGTGHTAVIDGTLELTGQNNYFNTAGSTVTVNGTLKNGGVLNVTTNITINGTFNNLTTYNSTISAKSINITSPGQMIINGTFENSATSPVSSTASNLTFAGGSIYNHNFTTATTGALNAIPTATWSNGSEVIIKGYTTFNAQVTGLGQTFSKFTWDCPNQTSASKPYINISGMAVLDAFYLKSTGAGALKISNSTATTVTVNNFVQTGGSLDFYSGTTTSLANTLKISGTFDQQGGTITESGSSTANTIEFNGTSSQSVNFAGTISNLINHTINNSGGITLAGTMPVNSGATLTISTAGSSAIGGTGTIAYTGITTLKYNSSTGTQTTSAVEFPTTNGPTNLAIDNSNGVSLSADGIVPGTLTLTTGLFRLNNYNLTINSLAVTSPSAAKMVVQSTGQLKKTFAAGASTFTFPIGEEAGTTDYLPVTLSFTANSLPRNIGVSMTNGKHVNMDVGGVQTDYLNRYWRFTDSEAGNGTYTYTAGFTYLPAEVNGTEANIKVHYWDGTSWTQIGSSAGSGQLSITSPQTESSAPLHNNDFTGRVTASNFYIWNGGTSSDWFTALNWTPAGTPAATDDVTISNASAIYQPVVPSGSAVSAKSLTLTAGSLSLAAYASLTVEGDFTFSAPASTNFDCSSTFTYASSGSQTIYDLAYGNLVSIGTAARTFTNGSIDICGSFTPGSNVYILGSSTINFNGTGSQIIPAFTYNNLSISGARGTNNVTFENSTLTIEGSFTSTASFTTGTFLPGTSTVFLNNTSPQTIPAINYYSLNASGGNRTLEPGKVTKIAGTFTPGTGTYTTTNSTVEFNGTTGTAAAPLVIPALTGNYNKVNVSGSGNFGFGGTMTLNGDYTQTAGTVAVAYGTGTTAKTININGDFYISGGNFYIVNSTTASSFNNVRVGTTASPKNLNITGTGSINLEATASGSTAGVLVVSGNFNSSTSATNALDFGIGSTGSNEVRIGGDLTMTGGRFNTTGGTPIGVTFNKAGAQTVNSTVTHNQTLFNVSSGSTVVLANNFTMGGTSSTILSKFTVSGMLDMAANTLTGGNTNNTFTVNSGATLKTSYASGLNGAVSNFSTRTFNSGADLEFTGTSAITNTTFPTAVRNLTISNTNTVTLGSSMAVSGAATVNSGTLDLGANQITSTGSFTVNANTLVKTSHASGLNGAVVSTGTKIFDAGADMEFYGSASTSNSSFPTAVRNLIISAPTLTFGSDMDISGTATINSGSSLDLGPNQLTGVGNITVNGTLKTASMDGLSGSATTALKNTLSSITLGTNSTIEYNGTGEQTITARPDYQNLTISGLRGGAAITLPAGTIGIAKAFTPAATNTSWITTGNTVAFNGNVQTIPAFADFLNVTISGGETKTLLGDIKVYGLLDVTTSILETGTHKVRLEGAAASVAETELAYVNGFVETEVDMNAAGAYSLNGIGLKLSPQTGSAFPGLTTILRTTGTPVIGANNSQSIDRVYKIDPAVNQNLNVNMEFSYWEHELGTIPEGRLEVFKSVTGNAPWALQWGSTVDVNTNTVSLSNIKDFSNWTLGGSATPLPVEMVAFEAKKAGLNAEITWATASENNSQGIEVQVSTNGKEFRKLGFIESRNGNSLQQYRFTDKENGKTGIRYYRLKQVDFDGTVSYFGPKTVRFEAEKLQVRAYPNPFEQEINLFVTATDAGKAQLKISDLTGKIIFEQEVTVKKGNNRIMIGIDKYLPTGMYVLQTRLGFELFTTRLLKK
jgi:hypothetical protein